MQPCSVFHPHPGLHEFVEPESALAVGPRRVGHSGHKVNGAKVQLQRGFFLPQ